MRKPPTYFGEWGNVPVDEDMRPFSILNPVGSYANRNNRRHHFISAVYMDGFADERGRVQVYRCEAPEDPHPMNPRAIGLERDYYSEKLPRGEGLQGRRRIYPDSNPPTLVPQFLSVRSRRI